MAITKLMHMKEAPGYKPKHLDNAIRYILDVRNDGAKTDFGKWVGGNSGLEHDEVLQSFLDTKKFWEKEEGRQGYHFVISFPPGEVDAGKCFEIIQDFCQEYLGDNYEYVFTVHTNEEHMHGHIIFNSLNRMTGYKYHYKKGDWEKYIQPVTDKICKEYGVAPLTFESEKIGVSYAQWATRTKQKLNWRNIIRADVDYAIERSTDMEEFFKLMGKMNYKLDIKGKSKYYTGNYITFIYTDDEGKEHRHRSYTLAGVKEDKYSLQEIEKNIRNKNLSEPYYEKISDALANKVNVRLGQTSTVLKSTNTFKRMYQAVSYYKLPNPFAIPQREVRRDMLRIEKLIEDCVYLKNHPSVTLSQMNKKAQSVEERLKELYILRKGLKDINEKVKASVLPADINRYRLLQKQLSEAREFDDRWESVEDEIEKLEMILPPSFIQNEKRLRRCERNIEILKKEKRVLKRVIETEGGMEAQLEKKMDIAKGL